MGESKIRRFMEYNFPYINYNTRGGKLLGIEKEQILNELTELEEYKNKWIRFHKEIEGHNNGILTEATMNRMVIKNFRPESYRHKTVDLTDTLIDEIEKLEMTALGFIKLREEMKQLKKENIKLKEEISLMERLLVFEDRLKKKSSILDKLMRR